MRHIVRTVLMPKRTKRVVHLFLLCHGWQNGNLYVVLVAIEPISSQPSRHEMRFIYFSSILLQEHMEIDSLRIVQTTFPWFSIGNSAVLINDLLYSRRDTIAQKLLSQFVAAIKAIYLGNYFDDADASKKIILFSRVFVLLFQPRCLQLELFPFS